MGTPEIVTATIFIIGLVVTSIGLYVKMVTDAAVSKTRHDYLQDQVNKLEKKCDEIEHDIVLKMDKMQQSIHNVEMNISKLLNKM